MKDVVAAKGLNDLRTATTHHIAAKPPRKGTTYLDLYSLSMEKQRLEIELSRLEHRRKRVQEHLKEIQGGMEKLLEAGQRETVARNPDTMPSVDPPAASSQQPRGRQWKKLQVEY